MQSTLTQIFTKEEITSKPLIKKEVDIKKKQKFKQAKIFKFCGQDEKLYNLKENLSNLKLITFKFNYNKGRIPIDDIYQKYFIKCYTNYHKKMKLKNKEMKTIKELVENSSLFVIAAHSKELSKQQKEIEKNRNQNRWVITKRHNPNQNQFAYNKCKSYYVWFQRNSFVWYWDAKC